MDGMKADIKELVGDERPIDYAERLQTDADGDSHCWTTGGGPHSNCTEIRAYWENGEMAAVPWLAIYRGGEIVARAPARYYEIGYAPVEVDEGEGGGEE